MKIGIIGAGHVGASLGAGWAKAGHTIKFGVRDPAKPEVAKALNNIGPSGTASSVVEAVAFAEVVVLATPWASTRAALESAGDLGEKTLIDCTNPIKPDLSGLTLGLDTSAGEQVALWAGHPKVVKCFNTTGAENMRNPVFGKERAVMFLAGDDSFSKAIVVQLGKDLGFEMVDAGPLNVSRLLEPYGMLWIHLAYKQGLGRNYAFTLQRHDAAK